MRLALLATVAVACGQSSSGPKVKPIEVPERTASAGDELLSKLPAGADSILELDLGRLRTNTVVGELFRLLTQTARVESANAKTPSLNLFGAGDLLIFVSYGIGDDEPERLVIVRGPDASSIPGGFAIDSKTVAIASGAMQKRLALVAAGEGESLAAASPLLRLRALAMPKGAPGAALRLAAHLDFDARIALAKALDIDDVPVSVSVWGDVVDDLAIVALVSGEDAGEGMKMAQALEGIRARLSRFSPVRRLGLGRLVRGAQIEKHGSAARMVLVVGPRRLARLVERILGRLRSEESA